MSNKLEISQLGRRLGSGLKFEVPKFYNFSGMKTEETIFEMSGVKDNFYISFHEAIGFYPLKNFKPILRSKDSLTKPIVHKGETFVPIEKLLSLCIKTDWSKIGGLKNGYSIDEYWTKIIHSGVFFGYNKKSHFFYIVDKQGFHKMVDNQLLLFNKLIEWNFVIDEPEGSYIKAEELETNPYEV